MICRKCSFILQGSEKFCPNCGAPSHEKSQNEKIEEESTPTPPSILFSAPKEEVDPPKEIQPRIFSEEDAYETAKSERKKKRAPTFLVAVLVFLVIALGGLTVMEYFDLAPVILQYLETGAVADPEETSENISETTEPAESEFPAEYGTISPDINFKNKLCCVASDKNIALRKGPDNSYAVLENLQSGTQLQVIGGSTVNDIWVYAYVPSFDIYGWVSSSFLSETDPFEGADESTSLTDETTENTETSGTYPN